MTKTIMFVCTENSARSQMAEGFFNHYNKNPDYLALSAGTEPATEVKPLAVAVMGEQGIDISQQTPRLLDRNSAQRAHRIFTMGCIKGCPLTPKEITVEWSFEDPAGKPIEAYRKTRDSIEKKIKMLLSQLAQTSEYNK